MRLRRNTRLLVEPPSQATGDIAFNLIVFFLVCASTQPDSGRKQTLPRAEQTKQEEKSENLQVDLTRQAVFLNGDPVRPQDFQKLVKQKLEKKPKPEDRIVVVKSKPDTPYRHWIAITSQIEDAGGIITMQLEEEQTVAVP